MNQAAQKNPLRALVAEDNEVTQKLISLFLEKLGFETTLVENGEDAIKKAFTSKYDVIFLDIVMPKADGYKACREIKSNPKSKNTPVIMLTGKDSFFDKMKGKRAGTDVYLLKPIVYEEIVKVLKTYFPDIKESSSHSSINNQLRLT